ncbi:MAG: short-chain dehydrogenase [Verrucomicrobia bacterium]|nr:MAG: short-chain dehydrogenase [Verrucomicrobiota bacterium]
MRLKDKIAIVTGAGHGIGRAIAELFAAEGAVVFMCSMNVEAGEGAAAEFRKAGGDARFIRCDVSQSDQVAQVVKTASERNGRIDVLCNNAAYIASTWHNSGDAPDDEWEKCFRVSLMGTQWFTKGVLPFMIRQNSGSIINIGSVQSLVAGRNSAAYTSIKTALVGLTRSVAYDYGPHNVRANVICAGAIRTRISPEPGSELHQRQISKTFLGRVGQPREVATAALFLACEESSYVTGAVLAVDGGWTAM